MAQLNEGAELVAMVDSDESLKEELIENKAFDKPLIMTSVYQNNLKNKTNKLK